MTRILAPLVPLALGLAACVEPSAPTPAPQPAAASGASIEERLSGSRLELSSTGSDPLSMVMELRADGTSATSAAGFVLTGKWDVEGNTLCQRDIRLGGMPSDDQTPQCVQVAIDGDRVTLTGEADDGSPETFTGTISAL